MNFSSFNEKLWFPGEKQGFGYNTKYPRMKSDPKTYYFLNEDKSKNYDFFNFSSFNEQLWIPGQKQGFGYKTSTLG